MYDESIQQTSIICEKTKLDNEEDPLVKEMINLMDNLLEKWEMLKKECETKHDKVHQIRDYYSWLLDVNEQKTWINEKLKSLNLDGNRENLAAVNRLLKK